MTKRQPELVEGFDMGFRPRGLFRGASRLAEIVSRIPEDVVEELHDESGWIGWTVEAADKIINREKLGITTDEWKLLRARIKKQRGNLEVLEESLAGVASNDPGANIICPCELIARWDNGKIVMLQRYDSDWGDGEDRELGRFDRIPTFGEAIRLVEMILNDPDWSGGLAVLTTWQKSLARRLPHWEMHAGSDKYPRLSDWFEIEWQRVLAGMPDGSAPRR